MRARARAVNRFIHSLWYPSVAGFSICKMAPRGVFIIKYLFFNNAKRVLSGWLLHAFAPLTAL